MCLYFNSPLMIAPLTEICIRYEVSKQLKIYVCDARVVVCTPYKRKNIDSLTLISNRKTNCLTRKELESGEIHNGIHVFVDKLLSTYSTIKPSREEYVLATGLRKDLVGVGNFTHDKDSAVFIKIKLNKKSLFRAIQAEVNRYGFLNKKYRFRLDNKTYYFKCKGYRS